MRIKVLQWNIFYREKIKNIIKFLKKEKPDIACFQELILNSELHDYKDVAVEIANALGFSYVFKTAQVQKNDKGEKSFLAMGYLANFLLFIATPNKFKNRQKIFSIIQR